jgi:arylsulfatase A-like enzyme
MPPGITRRELLAGAAALALAGCAEPAQRRAHRASTGPNFLFFLADDLGRECLGAYGGTSYATPRLDALARESLRFERCFSMPQCHPTRVALLTGRYPFRTNVRWGRLPETETTFAHVLANAGYATAVSGKWQLAKLKKDPEHPARSGFATSCCWGWHEGARYWDPLIWQDGVLRSDLRERYGPDVHTDFLIEFMAKRRTGPFLAYYPMTLPHLSSRGADGAPGAKLASYPELVAEMDRQVGRTLDALDALGLANDTLVLFAADNGSPRSVTSQLGGRSVRGGKASLRDAGTNVPLLARWPGAVPAGVCSDLVDVSDFLPTLAAVAGAELPDDVTLDGRSFATSLRGEAGARAWVYSGYRKGSFLRDARWKLTNAGELYDLERDPEENAAFAEVSDTPESAAARARLEAHVRAYFPERRLP